VPLIGGIYPIGGSSNLITLAWRGMEGDLVRCRQYSAEVDGRRNRYLKKK
jgi:hypothetical protein